MIGLVGIDEAALRRYQWLGDPACDRARSNMEEWRATGLGLVAHEGQQLTTLVCEALRPTTMEIVWRHGLMGAEPVTQPIPAGELIDRNLPAVFRAAVSYAVVDIEAGPVCSRMHDAGGLRLTDAVLDVLDRCELYLDAPKPAASGAPARRRVRLMEHLAGLIISDATMGADEGKA